MKYNQKMDLCCVVAEPNGMGGYTRTEEKVATINGYATPEKIETAISDGRLITIGTRKFFTKDQIPDNVEYIIFDGMTYHVINFADYGKVKMFETEVIGNGS